MLLARNVAFDEHHFRLIELTDFSAPEGQLSLLGASTALSRTALALIASGRMKPDAGDVWYEDDAGSGPAAVSRLRRRTALVDSPGITAPEHHMTVRQVVSESLALRPVLVGASGEPGRRRAFRPQVRSLDWLAHHGMDHLAKEKLVALDAESRLRLLTELAFVDPAVRCAVIDSPDRHRIAAEDLLRLLSGFADADQPRAILAVVAHAPEEAEAWVGGEISLAHEETSNTAPVPDPGAPLEREEPGEEGSALGEPEYAGQEGDEPEAADDDAADLGDLSALRGMMEDGR